MSSVAGFYDDVTTQDCTSWLQEHRPEMLQKYKGVGGMTAVEIACGLMAKGLGWAFVMRVRAVPGSDPYDYSTDSVLFARRWRASKTYIPPREEPDVFDLEGKAELEKFGLKVSDWVTLYYTRDENDWYRLEVLEKD